MTNVALVLPIQSSEDIVIARQKVRELAIKAGFNVVNQTKFITAASELARNTLDYGGGGYLTFEELINGNKKGLKLVFEDQGPGIDNIQLAMTDGYTTGKGLGLGLTGAKRLVNEFDLWTEVGKGTRISIIQWT
ncbi:MAG: serine/threonine-protein kinase RsbT [Candidatus Nitrotoga sp. SPKER]|nr:MAG: serine/threonine-protein kinase RsbT [Candidatus Nitrotoga sp. SPKER]